MREFVLLCRCSVVRAVRRASARAQSAAAGQQPVAETTSATPRSDPATRTALALHRQRRDRRPAATPSIYADRGGCSFTRRRSTRSRTGNVVFAQGNNRIAADRAEFNTETRLGTFYNATASRRIKPPKRSRRGLAPWRRRRWSAQQTVVYFFGETVEKLGPKKYRITNGGFTTCVQPTPRWDLHADTVDAEHRPLHAADATRC